MTNIFVFSFQRYRYTEAYQVDLKLRTLEKEFITKSIVDEEVLSRMRSASDWRERLIVSFLNFLELTTRIKNKAKQFRLNYACKRNVQRWSIL